LKFLATGGGIVLGLMFQLAGLISFF